MDSFDIGRLTDFDFEEVCKDLFENHFSIPLEIFSTGQDGGIDLRYLGVKNRPSLVIQCKHWQRSGRASLIRHMRESELPKIVKLNPERYVLATSAELTVDAKDKLIALLKPYASGGDIFGVNDIQALLRQNPHVVGRHLRLWLNSAAVLDSLLNRGILTRSAWLVEEIRESIKTFVPNEAYTIAETLLRTRHVCVVTGNPGTGKTTLAQILAATYLSDGYELIDVSEDIQEINSVWNDDVRQFFYYDDFLGQSSLDDKLGKNEDRRLVNMLDRIQRSTNKYLVMTTREYILRQAQQRYERLSRYDLAPLTCIIDLRNLPAPSRANVLYNHVYFSGIDSSQIKEVAQRDNFRQIVSHRNFNPRLISFITTRLASAQEAPESLAQALIKHLDEPATLWEHIVENQLDDYSVQLLLVLRTFSSRGALSTDLAKALESQRGTLGAQNGTAQFRRSIKTLEETMIGVRGLKGGHDLVSGTLIRFHNPSVRDFMSSYIGKSPEFMTTLLKSAIYFEQIEEIWNMGRNWMGTSAPVRLNHYAQDISEAIIRTFDSESAYDPQYLLGRQRIVDICRRLTEAMQMANALKLHSVGAFVRTYLDQNDVASIEPQTDWLVSVVKALWSSTDPQLMDIRERVLEKVIEHEVASIDDWDSARAVMAILDELGNIAPLDAIDEVQSQLHEYFLECLDALRMGGKIEDPVTYDLVEDIREYAQEVDIVEMDVIDLALEEYRVAHDIPRPGSPVPGQLSLFDVDVARGELEVIREALADLAKSPDDESL